MPRGFTNCTICGKKVISIYRKHHESHMCLRMRFLRGDVDVVRRFKGKVPKGKVLPRRSVKDGKAGLPFSQKLLISFFIDVEDEIVNAFVKAVEEDVLGE